jgi:hypothetical protein
MIRFVPFGLIRARSSQFFVSVCLCPLLWLDPRS